MELVSYRDLIKNLKSTILQSRYVAARLANRELLNLYFQSGRMINEQIMLNKWGAKIIDKISSDLQIEQPGLRGFSAGNLKKMRMFYTEWAFCILFGPSVTGQISLNVIEGVIGPSMTGQFIESFYSIGFTHHYLILIKTKTLDERIFYIQDAACNFLTTRVLEKNLNENLYKSFGGLPNNFQKTLPETVGNKAVRMFKDEYLFDYLNTEEEDDERVFENSIMQNIRKFIMTLGADFAFIGNQYRIMVDGEELFIDLLFFNRKIQSLVAIELKRGKFKAEYAGKMNLYLSALDEYVKQPHENPSIGIVLCKEKNDKIVEFSFRDFNKAMGVATYKTSREIPSQYEGILPNADVLRDLID